MPRRSRPKARSISSPRLSLSGAIFLAALLAGLTFSFGAVPVAAQERCPDFDLAEAEAALEQMSVVLVADVTNVTASSVTLAPVAYLKGAARARRAGLGFC